MFYGLRLYILGPVLDNLPRRPRRDVIPPSVFDLLAELDCQTRTQFRLPLDIWALVQTSQSELLKDKGVMRQME